MQTNFYDNLKDIRTQIRYSEVVEAWQHWMFKSIKFVNNSYIEWL